MTGEIIDTLCAAATPEALEEWAAAFESVCGPLMKPAKRELSPGEKIVNKAADEAHGGGTWVGSKRSEADGRKLAQKIMEAKRPHKSGSNK